MNTINNLMKFKYIYISYTNYKSYLNVKMIKFDNSITDNCDISNINILCYKPDTYQSLFYKI